MQAETCRLCGEPEIDHNRTPGLICAHCGEPAQGCFSIHISSSMDGPTVPLCFECGKDPNPTCGEIWNKIQEDIQQGWFQPDALNGATTSTGKDSP